jgi:hypothetical protein
MGVSHPCGTIGTSLPASVDQACANTPSARALPPPLIALAPHSTQVLRALADPSSPDLAAALRAAAAAVSKTKRRDLRLWLEGGLFTHLLGILQALPTLGLSPSLAAELCAAAAAGVCNIIDCALIGDMTLPPGVTARSLMQQAARPDVTAAVVHSGVVHIAAAGQLPPGREPYLACKADVLAVPQRPGDEEFRGGSFSRLFNTPRTACLKLLTMTVPTPEWSLADLDYCAALAPLLDGGVFEHILAMVVHAPLHSKHPPEHARRTCSPAVVRIGLMDVLYVYQRTGKGVRLVCFSAGHE